MNKKPSIQCPTCKKRFDAEEDLEVGDTTYCPECYEELEVKRTNPLEVSLVEADNSATVN